MNEENSLVLKFSMSYNVMAAFCTQLSYIIYCYVLQMYILKQGGQCFLLTLIKSDSVIMENICIKPKYYLLCLLYLQEASNFVYCVFLAIVLQSFYPFMCNDSCVACVQIVKLSHLENGKKCIIHLDFHQASISSHLFTHLFTINLLDSFNSINSI